LQFLATFQRLRRALPAAVVAVVCLTGVARADKVDYELKGVDNDDIRKNIEQSLSIANPRDKKKLTGFEIIQLHARAQAEIQDATGGVNPAGNGLCVPDVAQARQLSTAERSGGRSTRAWAYRTHAVRARLDAER
jgi:hypothetical protein